MDGDSPRERRGRPSSPAPLPSTGEGRFCSFQILVISTVPWPIKLIRSSCPVSRAVPSNASLSTHSASTDRSCPSHSTTASWRSRVTSFPSPRMARMTPIFGNRRAETIWDGNASDPLKPVSTTASQSMICPQGPLMESDTTASRCELRRYR